jgi:uncharacterized membrane protein YphA (DoxX/SURF4 family)
VGKRDFGLNGANKLFVAGSRQTMYETLVLTTKLSAMPKGVSPLNWLDDFLYLPEVLYVLLFIWLICSGPGKFSVDYWLAGQLLR